jgi:hypothetical protein
MGKQIIAEKIMIIKEAKDNSGLAFQGLPQYRYAWE